MPRRKESESKGNAGDSEKKLRMRTANDVLNRLKWDSIVGPSWIKIGYLDRFTGIEENVFTKVPWEDLVQHRIMYVKLLDRMVWDKQERLDLVFGSTGSGITLEMIAADIRETIVASRAHESKIIEHGGAAPASATQSARGAGNGRGGSWSEAGKQKRKRAGWQKISSTHSGSNHGSAPSRYERFNRDVGGGVIVPREEQRPNYFLCLRIQDEALVALCKAAQDAAVTAEPLLQQSRLDEYRFHVSVVMIRIESQPMLRAAQAAMREAAPALLVEAREALLAGYSLCADPSSQAANLSSILSTSGASAVASASTGEEADGSKTAGEASISTEATGTGEKPLGSASGMRLSGPHVFGNRVAHLRPAEGENLEWLLRLRAGFVHVLRRAGVIVLEAQDVPDEDEGGSHAASGAGVGHGQMAGIGRRYSPHMSLINLRRGAAKGLPDGIPSKAVDAMQKILANTVAIESAATASGTGCETVVGTSRTLADSAWLCSMMLPRQAGRFYPTAFVSTFDGSQPGDVPPHEATPNDGDTVDDGGDDTSFTPVEPERGIETLRSAPWSALPRKGLAVTREERLDQLRALAREQAVQGQRHAMAARAHAKYEWNHRRAEEGEPPASYWDQVDRMPLLVDPSSVSAVGGLLRRAAAYMPLACSSATVARGMRHSEAVALLPPWTGIIAEILEGRHSAAAACIAEETLQAAVAALSHRIGHVAAVLWEHGTQEEVAALAVPERGTAESATPSEETIATTVATAASSMRPVLSPMFLRALLDSLRSCSSSKIVVITRGVSGSGKSSAIREIRDAVRQEAGTDDDLRAAMGPQGATGWDVTVCSADKYFEVGLLPDDAALYSFDGSRLRQAHDACKAAFAEALDGPNLGVIVVDNTNIKTRDAQPYAVLARERHVPVAEIRFDCPSEGAAVALSVRNSHSVPAETTLKMRAGLAGAAKSVVPGKGSGLACTVLVPGLPADIAAANLGPGGLTGRMLAPVIDSAIAKLRSKPCRDQVSTQAREMRGYIGVFLDSADQATLLRRSQRVLPGGDWKTYGDHMTVRFAPSAFEIAATSFGMATSLKARVMVVSNTVAAAVVEPESLANGLIHVEELVERVGATRVPMVHAESLPHGLFGALARAEEKVRRSIGTSRTVVPADMIHGPSENRIAHITIATNRDGNPFQSNMMLERCMEVMPEVFGGSLDLAVADTVRNQAATPIAGFRWDGKANAWRKRVHFATGTESAASEADADDSSHADIYIFREATTLVGRIGFKPGRSSADTCLYDAGAVAASLARNGGFTVAETMPLEGSGFGSSADLGEAIIESVATDQAGKGSSWEQTSPVWLTCCAIGQAKHSEPVAAHGSSREPPTAWCAIGPDVVSLPQQHWPSIMMPHPVPQWAAGAIPVSHLIQPPSAAPTANDGVELTTPTLSIEDYGPPGMLRSSSLPDEDLGLDVLEMRALAMRPLPSAAAALYGLSGDAMQSAAGCEAFRGVGVGFLAAAAAATEGARFSKRISRVSVDRCPPWYRSAAFAAIKELHVFDFDCTVACGPSVEEAASLTREEFGVNLSTAGHFAGRHARLIGAGNPHGIEDAKNFLASPQALQAPVPVLPGAALSALRARAGRANTAVVILTGRVHGENEEMKLAIEGALANFGVRADAIFCRTPSLKTAAETFCASNGIDADRSAISVDSLRSKAYRGTCGFKRAMLRGMLALLPSLERLTCWDDLTGNLASMRDELKAQTRPLERPPMMWRLIHVNGPDNLRFGSSEAPKGVMQLGRPPMIKHLSAPEAASPSLELLRDDEDARLDADASDVTDDIDDLATSKESGLASVELLPVRNTCIGTLRVLQDVSHGEGLVRLMAGLGSIRTPAFTRAGLDAADLVLDTWADVVGKALGLPSCAPARLIAAAASSAKVSDSVGTNLIGPLSGAGAANQDGTSVGFRRAGDASLSKLPPALGLLSGSFPLGRAMSDVDLTLLAPPADGLDVATCAQLLATALQQKGVQLVYCAGTDARIARVVCRLSSTKSAAVEVDCCFAPMPTMARFREAHCMARGLYWDPSESSAVVEDVPLSTLPHRLPLPAAIVFGTGEDATASEAEVSGGSPALSSVIKLHSSGVSFAAFHRLSVALCLDYLCALLERAGVKGTHTNALRTFHVVQLLADAARGLVPSRRAGCKWGVAAGAGELLAAAIQLGAGMSVKTWRSAVGLGLEKTEVPAAARAIFLWVSNAVISKEAAGSASGSLCRLATADVLLRTLQSVPLGFVAERCESSRASMSEGELELELQPPRRLEACRLGVEWHSKASEASVPKGLMASSAAGLLLAASYRLTRFVRSRLPSHVMTSVGSRSAAVRGLAVLSQPSGLGSSGESGATESCSAMVACLEGRGVLRQVNGAMVAYSGGSTLSPEASSRGVVGGEAVSFLAMRGHPDGHIMIESGTSGGKCEAGKESAVGASGGKARALSVRLLAPLQAELNHFQKGAKGAAQSSSRATTGLVMAAGGAIAVTVPPCDTSATPMPTDGTEAVFASMPVEIGFGKDLLILSKSVARGGSALPAVGDMACEEQVAYVKPSVLRVLAGMLQVRLRSFAID